MSRRSGGRGSQLLYGILLGTAAAIFWSINNVLAAAALRSVRPTTGALVSLAASLVFIVPMALLIDPTGFAQLSLIGIAWFGLLGLLNFPGGRFLSYAAMRQIGASRAIMIRNATPVMIVILGIVLYGEQPSLQVLIGAALIVGGLYVAVEDPAGKKAAAVRSEPQQASDA